MTYVVGKCGWQGKGCARVNAQQESHIMARKVSWLPQQCRQGALFGPRPKAL